MNGLKQVDHRIFAKVLFACFGDRPEKFIPLVLSASKGGVLNILQRDLSRGVQSILQRELSHVKG